MVRDSFDSDQKLGHKSLGQNVKNALFLALLCVVCCNTGFSDERRIFVPASKIRDLPTFGEVALVAGGELEAGSFLLVSSSEGRSS